MVITLQKSSFLKASLCPQKSSDCDPTKKRLKKMTAKSYMEEDRLPAEDETNDDSHKDKGGVETPEVAKLVPAKR